MSDNQPSLSDEAVLDLYEKLLTVRRSEERLSRLFADGEIPGFIHLSIGQEAIAVGVGNALNASDTIASTHRGHGHALAKGMALDSFFLELMGRAEGVCQGRGGSMHVADLSIGMLGANGIVGAGAPIALGSALAHQLLRPGSISVAFVGDGALAEGALYETLNMASLWQAPLLVVCENNGWAEFSQTEQQFVAKLAELANAFHIPAQQVDGDDVLAVTNAAAGIIDHMRQGAGPQVLECMTHRVRGHFEGDPQKYRAADELASLTEHDPVARCAGHLRQRGVADSTLKHIEVSVRRRIDDAVSKARAGSQPSFEHALNDVYSPIADSV